jgi:hypothetical protein
MPITFSTVACSEFHTSLQPQQETIGREDWTAQATLQCAWADRHALVFDILSNQRVWPYGSHSLKPRAHQCSIGVLPSSGSQDGQGYSYSDALVTVHYAVPPDGGGDQPLISEEIEPATEFITLDHKAFLWTDSDGDPLLEDESPGKLVRTVRFRRTYFQVPPGLHVDFINLPGSCNNDSVSSSSFGMAFAAQTLVFEDPIVSRTIKTDGSGYALTVATSFLYKNTGWNKFWRAKTQTFETIVTRDGTPYINYPLATWTNIWI